MRSRQTFSHHGLDSAWHYFAGWLSIKWWMFAAYKFITTRNLSWHWL